MSTDYGYTRKTSASFAQAVEHATQALAEEGFGVLTEIDVQSTIKDKLGADMDSYHILGACNPSFAHQALTAEHEIGLLLPCNVLVYVREGQTFISAVRPSRMLSVVDNDAVRPIADQVEQKLIRVVDAAAA